jgi:hypothetical protein
MKKIWPEKLDEDLGKILGLPNFSCGPIAQLLRMDGCEIPRKAEAEQAYVLHWLVGIYLEHGSEWYNVAMVRLNAIEE